MHSRMIIASNEGMWKPPYTMCVRVLFWYACGSILCYVNNVKFSRMKKIFVKNRKGQNIAVVIEQPQGKMVGLAFVMHGLGGFKEQKHVRTMAKAFFDNQCTTITFDTTNTFGESDGNYDDATTTNYFEDLEDVIDWAKNQGWYKEPFFLTGHSLGAIAVALYAEKYPKMVNGLAPLGTVVSGKLSMSIERDLESWKKLGYKEKISRAKPGMVGKLKWSHMEDRLKYDLVPEANLLTMPVLMVVGSKDEPCPPEHEKILYDVLLGPKEFHLVDGAPHTFRDDSHIKQLYDLLDRWIKKIIKIKTNNYAFIDSQNLNLGIQNLGWKLDYKKFRIYLAEKYCVQKAYIFIGFVALNQKLYDRLQESGFILHFKPTIPDDEGKIKGNVDADVVLSSMVEWNNYDKAIIVSSDGDFYSLIAYLYENNKLETVLSPDKEECSSLLKQTAKERIHFMDNLQRKLEYKKKSTA